MENNIVQTSSQPFTLNNQVSVIDLYADRTSSTNSLASHFSTFMGKESAIQYAQTPSAIFGACEPICEKRKRILAVLEFFEFSNFVKRRGYFLPVSEELAQEAKKYQLTTYQVGAEPVFELRPYFSDEKKDPVFQIPKARSLKNKGAAVTEIKGQPNLIKKLEKLQLKWLETKPIPPLQFLTKSKDLLELTTQDRVFILSNLQGILGYLVAIPIPAQNAYYFCDIIKAPHAPHGATELLIIETMRTLANEGVLEIRLGMCPLAGIEEKQNPFYNLYHSEQTFYSFKNLYRFRQKLMPTRWDSLFLISNQSSQINKKFMLFSDLFQVHIAQSSSESLCSCILRVVVHFFQSWFSHYIHPQYTTIVTQWKRSTEFTKSMTAYLAHRMAITFWLTSFFLIVHFLKNNYVPAFNLFTQSAYSPVKVETSLQFQNLLAPLFVGSIFHNHWFHLTGDLLSLLFFGGLYEWMFGKRNYFIVIATGLWLSNPLSHWILKTFLKNISPSWYQAFLLELDYGSSNGVYALIGGLSATLKKPQQVLIPFAGYAIFLCYRLESWLAIHHLVALFSGFFITLELLYKRRSLL